PRTTVSARCVSLRSFRDDVPAGLLSPNSRTTSSPSEALQRSLQTFERIAFARHASERGHGTLEGVPVNKLDEVRTPWDGVSIMRDKPAPIFPIAHQGLAGAGPCSSRRSFPDLRNATAN